MLVDTRAAEADPVYVRRTALFRSPMNRFNITSASFRQSQSEPILHEEIMLWLM
jgi:hypothetical protein